MKQEYSIADMQELKTGKRPVHTHPFMKLYVSLKIPLTERRIVMDLEKRTAEAKRERKLAAKLEQKRIDQLRRDCGLIA